jgi:hypothetical protein
MNLYTQEHELNLKQIRLAAELIESGADDFEIDATLILVDLANRTAVQREIGIRAARKFLIDLLNQRVSK